MSTSALRAGLLLAAVVIGAVIIANAFPSGGTSPAVASRTPSPRVVPTPSASPKPHKLQCSTTTGSRVAIENATTTAGLAAATAKKVETAGYTINADTDIGTAATQSQTTTLYFRGPDNKPAARCLKKKFFTTAEVRPLPASASAGTTPAIAPLVQVAVFLGADYAATHPVA